MTVPADGSEAPGAAPEGVPEGAPEGTPEVDEFVPIPGEPDTFPRDYVERLRSANAANNVRRREAEEKAAALEPLAGVFEGWEPDQVEGWKTFLGQAQQDPEGAIKALMADGFGYDREGAIALLDTIYGAGGDEPPAPVGTPGDSDDLNRPLTRAEYDQLKAQEAQEAELAQAVGSVKREATELGYKPDADPTSEDGGRYERLLSIAARTPDHDLSKAHEALVAEEQAIVQRHLARMAEEADGSPAAPGTPGSPGAAVGPPKSFEDAATGAREFLASRTSH